MSKARLESLRRDVAACRICEAHLPLGPRPIASFSDTSRLVIIGQAPGIKVHESGIPWDDASGERLLEWTGLSAEQLHDPAKVALVPMGFCYPGKGKSGDNPPRPECAPQWHPKILAMLPDDRLTLLVGSYAQPYYLPETRKLSMTARIKGFRDYLPRYFPLPHPSWRSGIWMKKNRWFEAEVLPELRGQVARHL